MVSLGMPCQSLEADVDGVVVGGSFFSVMYST
jgi:hypothetical protein